MDCQAIIMEKLLVCGAGKCFVASWLAGEKAERQAAGNGSRLALMLFSKTGTEWRGINRDPARIFLCARLSDKLREYCAGTESMR